MKRNEVLKHLYKKLYNNGEFSDLVVSPTIISKLNTYYKKNFSSFTDFQEFFDNMGELSVQLLLSKSAFLEFRKQFSNQKGLQPAIITECFMAQTVANVLDLTEFIDADDKESHIPLDIGLNLVTIKTPTGSVNPRYIYHNKQNTILLLQYGDASSIDAIFVKNKSGIRIEFKEEKSKLTEPDITGLYGEDGKLIIDDKFRSNYPHYIEFINVFNEKTSIFKHIGRNFNIKEYCDAKTVERITADVLKIKIIDLFILQKKTKLYPIIADDLLNHIDISGSEIRTAGRNHTRYFTPKYMRNILFELGALIVEDEVYMPYDKKSKSIGRNLSVETRYKINNLLFVYLEDVTIISDKIISFNLSKVKQLKPTISLHLNVVPNVDKIRNTYESMMTKVKK